MSTPVSNDDHPIQWAPKRNDRQAVEQRLADRRTEPWRPSETPLVWVAVATGLGGAGFSLVNLTPIAAAALSATTLCGWLAAWLQRHDGLASHLLLSAVSLLAAAWGGARWDSFTTSDIGRYAPSDAEPVALDVVVAGTPELYPADEPSPFRAIPSTDRTIIAADVVALRDATDWQATSGRCEITVAGELPDTKPGDRLRVFGQLRKPSPAMNPGQRDAAARDRAERCLATVWTESPSCVTSQTSNAKTFFALAIRFVFRLRQSALNTLERHASPGGAQLAKAMLLGDATALPRNVVEAFRHTGTLHVLVVSGLHVGLVAAFLPCLAALGVLPRRVAWLGSLALVLIYVAITGGRPPALRAGIVAVGVIIAALCGRRPINLNSLAGAAVAVFAFSPGAWQSVGTQLSFLATATLLFVAAFASRRQSRPLPPLERLILSTRSPIEKLSHRLTSWMGWLLAATIAVQLVTIPLVAAEFHLVSPAAAPLAVVVSPLIATTVASGLITLLSDSAGLDWVADLAGVLCGVSAKWLGRVVESTATYPGASFWTAGPAPWWAGMWISCFALVAAAKAYGRRVRGMIGRLGLVLAAAAFAPTLWSYVCEEPALRISFIAVGHGSATLVEPPGGGAILVDAGALGSPERATDTVARALWSRGIRRIDLLLLTHPDVDHYNAVPGLLERFEIGAVGTTALMFADEGPKRESGPTALRRLLRASDTQVRELGLGDRIPLAGAEMIVLHPDDIGVVGSDNANSLVLGIEHAGRRVLLPGDLESPGLDAVLTQEPYDCDLLLAPHHGSPRSNPPGFAAWCQPESVIISSGEPRVAAADAYEVAGSEVWSTYNSGMLTARVSADGVRVDATR